MAFIDDYDCAMFDLDGVIYLGPEAVTGAAWGLGALRAAGIRVGFVTNNAGRSADVVVAHLNALGIECHRADVVTSSQSIAQLMLAELPAGAKVLVCGAQALADEIRAVGFQLVADHTEQPAAVVQGYDPEMDFPRLDDACFAIQRGARWFASNSDINRPTNLGMVPGAGAQVACVQVCVDVAPLVAGKPYPPLLTETIRRMAARRPVFVGDRLDTDVEGANNVQIDSFLVFTGVHGKYDLVAAIPKQRPTAIGYDLRDLLKPARMARAIGDRVRCGRAEAWQQNGQICCAGPLTNVDEQLDALWAICQLSWQRPAADCTSALDRLDLLK